MLLFLSKSHRSQRMLGHNLPRSSAPHEPAGGVGEPTGPPHRIHRGDLENMDAVAMGI